MENNTTPNPFINNTQPQPTPQPTPQPAPQPNPQPVPPPVQPQPQPQFSPQPPSPSTPIQNNPTAPTGIFTEGSAPVQTTQLSTPSPEKHSKKPLIFAVIAVLLIILGVGGFFLVQKLTSPKKTTAEFESIMVNLGYEKNSTLTQSSSEGSYTTYGKTITASTGGIAMFYEVNSKNTLKSLVTQASSWISETYNPTSSFDWSKERNAANECYSENPYVCTSMIQIDNTMLIVLYMADSLEESKSEVDKVVTTMGY